MVRLPIHAFAVLFTIAVLSLVAAPASATPLQSSAAQWSSDTMRRRSAPRVVARGASAPDNDGYDEESEEDGDDGEWADSRSTDGYRPGKDPTDAEREDVVYAYDSVAAHIFGEGDRTELVREGRRHTRPRRIR